jgi:hypothetical protein
LDFAAGILTLTGGNLPAEGSCNFGVLLQVPGGISDGTFTNTTTAIKADIGGDGVVGNMATDNLVIESAPILTKTFIDDPVGAGGVVTLRFTVTNSSSNFNVGEITFEDVFNEVLPTASTVPADGFCGGSSTATFIPLINPSGSDATPARLLVEGASLDPTESCSFDLVLDVAPGAAVGSYLNTTGVINGLLDNEIPVTGVPASDTLEIVAAPTLKKEFTDDPVQPGGPVTLEFTLAHDALAPGDATAIGFTDDLTFMSGLEAVGLPANDVCGAGSQISGTTSLSFTGGTLAQGATCIFSVTLQVPQNAQMGSHANTTSDLTATVLGMTATENPASDDLRIAGLELTKEFTDDPVIPGGTVNLRFTIDNTSTLDASDISFVDDLGVVLEGLLPVGLPLADLCGGGQLTEQDPFGPSYQLVFAGGALDAGQSCSFDVTLNVPADAPSDSYLNTTSLLAATVDSTLVQLENASDSLIVSSGQLLFSKSFTDDPVTPGSTVTLEFTVENTNVSNPVTDVAFTDDLGAALTGLAAVGLPANDVCGAGSQLTGTDTLTLTGGNLGAASSCTFSATLQVPGDAPAGSVTNTTSELTGTIGTLAVNGDPATDDLVINSLTFSKAFEGAVENGHLVKLTFTLENPGGSSVADLSFSDNLDAVVSGLMATGLPANDVCGSGSVLAGTSILILTGGNLGPGGSCSFDVVVHVPLAATQGTYTNTTSDIQIEGLSVSGPAIADLEVFEQGDDPGPDSNCYSADTATGTGQATLCFTGGGDGCQFGQVEYIPLAGHAQSPPAGTTPDGISFPHGLAVFTLQGCTPGFTVDLDWNLPSTLPEGTQYWKYGPTPDDSTPHWYILPSTIAFDTVSFSVTDGALGDDDLTADGTVIDQGGPGTPPGGAQRIPMVTTGPLLLLAALLALIGFFALQRRNGLVSK